MVSIRRVVTRSGNWCRERCVLNTATGHAEEALTQLEEVPNRKGYAAEPESEPLSDRVLLKEENPRDSVVELGRDLGFDLEH